MKNATAFIAVTAGSVVASAPAFAGVVQRVPEPSALGLIAGAVVAMIITTRFMRRK